MAEATAEVVQLGLEPMLMWMALLSANLGFFNLLPIPVLDGGHLAFYVLEAIRRRPLSARVHAVGYRLGFAFIIGLDGLHQHVRPSALGSQADVADRAALTRPKSPWARARHRQKARARRSVGQGRSR